MPKGLQKGERINWAPTGNASGTYRGLHIYVIRINKLLIDLYINKMEVCISIKFSANLNFEINLKISELKILLLKTKLTFCI